MVSADDEVFKFSVKLETSEFVNSNRLRRFASDIKIGPSTKNAKPIYYNIEIFI
jgi:hypothetical protein